MTAKAEEIRRVLSEPVVDLWKLRELALTEGGLINDSIRKLAWPKLAGVSNDAPSTSTYGSNNEVPSNPPPTSEVTIPPSLDAEQIDRDISRVTWHLLTGNQRSRNFQMRNKHRKRISQLLKKKQRRLGDFLNLTLVQSYGDKRIKEVERFRYYQGYHDVGSIVLSTLGGASSPTAPSITTGISFRSDLELALIAADSMGMTLACQVLLQISQQHLRDPMRANFIQLQAALKLVLMPLIATFDSELHSHLFDCDMEPFFAIPWIITWFAHDVRDTAVVKRLFDFFLVSHPMMPIYMSVAMTIHPLNRIEILSTDCDFACVHNALANLPKNSNDVGWKYIPGDISCYVDNDDDEISLVSGHSMDPSLQATDDDSVISSTSPKSRVPFQELIDLSISLMHKIPPRNLVSLAQRYHNNVTLQPFMAESSSIALLQPPPSWGLASNIASDWVIRQRKQKEQGTKLNRHQRKNRKKRGIGSESVNDNDSASMTSMVSIISTGKVVKPLQAIIASGTGPDGREEARTLRKKRKIVVQSVVVIMVSLAALVAKRYFLSNPVPQEQPKLSQISVEEDHLVIDECSLDETKELESTKIVLDDMLPQPDQQKNIGVTIEVDQRKEMSSPKQKVDPLLNDDVISKEGENEIVSAQINSIREDYSSSTKNGSIKNEESSPTKNDTRNHSGSNIETQQLAESSQIAVITQSRTKQLKRAYDQIKAAVEEEISIDDEDGGKSAAVAQEIWRKHALNVKLQGERLLNLSKECLARGNE